MVLVLLAILWAWILLPGALRARRDASPVSSVDSFERTMGMLARHSGKSPPRPTRSSPGRHVLVLRDAASVTGARRRSRAVRRRRTLLLRLQGAVGLTAVPAIALGGLLWLLFAAAWLALLVYVLLLLEHRARRDEIRRKVRRLPQRPAAATSAPPAVRESRAARLRHRPASGWR